MKVNTIISQRLKLAQQDLVNADWETVFSRVISQDRNLTPEEIEAEKTAVRALYDNSRAVVENLQNNSEDYFRTKIQAQNMTKAELVNWTVHAAERVLQLEGSDKVGETGFIPDAVRFELHQLLAEKKANAETVLSEARVTELLSYCMQTLTMVTLCTPSAETVKNAEAESENRNISEDALAMKAVKALREAGKLPEYWNGVNDSEIAKLFYFVRQDDTVHESNQSLIRALTDLYVLDFLKTKEEATVEAVELTEADIEARHLLAVAVIRNMRITNKLPEEFSSLSDEELAVVAYAGTQMNFYFNEAAAGHLSMDLFMRIAEKLVYAIVLTVVAAVMFVESGFFCKIVLALFSFGVLCILLDAIDDLLSSLFPAGVDETRIGIAVKAGIGQIRNFAAKATEKLADVFAVKRGESADPVGEDAAAETVVNTQQAEDEFEDEYEDEDYDENEDD